MSLSFSQHRSKWILAAFLGGLLIPQWVAPLLSANVSNPYGSLELNEAVENFHEQMNDITNDFIERLVDEDNPEVTFPQDDESCEDTNVSTYCLSEQLNEELYLFEVNMASRVDRFDIEVDEDSSQITLEQAITASNARKNSIDAQIQQARDTVELSLALYNQIQLVYPVHQELLTLTSNLEEYRNLLADVRDSVELYPADFHDAVTLQCQWHKTAAFWPPCFSAP